MAHCVQFVVHIIVHSNTLALVSQLPDRALQSGTNRKWSAGLESNMLIAYCDRERAAVSV